MPCPRAARRDSKRSGRHRRGKTQPHARLSPATRSSSIVKGRRSRSSRFPRSPKRWRFDGIVRGASASGGTLYVEPREVTELGNKLQMAEAEVEREVARVLGALSRSVSARIDALRIAVEAITVSDVLAALSRWGVEAEANVLDMAAEDEIVLRSF